MSVLSYWIVLNIFVVAAFLISHGSSRFLDVLRVNARGGFKVCLDRALLLMVVVSLPMTSLIAPRSFEWTGQEMRGDSQSVPLLRIDRVADGEQAVEGDAPEQGEIKILNIIVVFEWIFFISLWVSFLLLGWTFFRWRRFSRSLEETFLWKSLGRVQVRLSDRHAVAFATWWGRRFVIVLPSHSLENSNRMHLCLKHEAQHLRNGDVFWGWAAHLLVLLCPFNPLVYRWVRQMSDRCESFCDEVLCTRRGVSFREYGLCLIWAADQNQAKQSDSAFEFGAVGMSSRPAHRDIKRRIEVMKTLSEQNKRPVVVALMLVGALAGWAGVTWAVAPVFAPRPLEVAEVQGVIEASSAENSLEFPLELTPEVMDRLNYLVRTSRGREHVRRTIVRMAQFDPMVDKALDRYGYPDELKAVAFIESAFQNLPPSGNPFTRAAGLWQFMAQTARNYDLRVDDVVDERLDVVKETDAAMRYLGANYLRFRDWRLSLIAYNVGENRVQKGIVEHKTRNPWELYRAGIKGDDYLPKVIAVALILKHPELRDL